LEHTTENQYTLLTTRVGMEHLSHRNYDSVTKLFLLKESCMGYMDSTFGVVVEEE